MKNLDVIDFEEYCAIEDEQGQRFIAYNDIEKLQKEMERISPEDTKVIHEFITGIRKLIGFILPVEKPLGFMSFSEKLKLIVGMLPKIPSVLKWYPISNGEFAERFKNPLLRRFFTSSYPADFSIMVTMINCGWLYQKGAGYPIGGSLKVSELMEKKYLACGGKINYRSKVDKILVKDDSACGIRLADESIHHADIVISAADGYSTIYKMLEGKYTGKRIKDIYENGALQTQVGMMFVSIGVSRTFDNEPHWIFIPLEKSLYIDDNTILNELAVTIVNYDPTASEKGKSCITLMLSSNDYNYWVKLKNENDSRYQSEKKRIGDEIIDVLESRFGDFKQHVEVCDIATPATYIRYTANWKASNGFSASKKTFLQSVPKELNGLSNFYMAGLWTEIGGGVPMCMISGRNAAQLICKKDKVKFRTSVY